MKINKPFPLIALLVIVLSLGSCAIDDAIYDTDHPDHGEITLTIDWSGRGAGIDIPSDYTVKVGDYSATLSGATNTIDNLFVPGTYRGYVYNTADKITVSGTTASVANYGVEGDFSGTYLDHTPGWFFSGTVDAAIEKDTDYSFTALMQQQVRQLTLLIEPGGGTTERISSITGTLSGVAGSIDIDNNTHGNQGTVLMSFSKITTGADSGKWLATVRLLGIAGNSQTLRLTVNYDDDIPAEQLEEYELHEGLSTFNTGKHTPLTLGGTLVQTPTEAGFTSVIIDWTIIERDYDVIGQ